MQARFDAAIADIGMTVQTIQAAKREQRLRQDDSPRHIGRAREQPQPTHLHGLLQLASRQEILAQLSRGEINVQEATRLLSQLKGDPS